jgi:hypothetical protein
MRSAADLLDAIADHREAEQARERAEREFLRSGQTGSESAYRALLDAQAAEKAAIERLDRAAA